MQLRWKIGAVTVTSVIESATPTSPRYIYGSAISKADVVARAATATWLRPHFVSKDGYLLQQIQCLVIDTGDHKVAVDTCVGNDKNRPNELWDHQHLPFLDDLAAAGYRPESITEVVCTHLHVDHVGWNTRLVDGQWVPTFPNARYLFATTEYEHWKDEAAADPNHGEAFADSVAPIIEAGLADLVPVDHRLCDEITFQPTPGHTPGHFSVMLSSGGERGVITGDLAHNPLQLADPDVCSIFDSDPDEARATRRAVLADWADGETTVIGTHFGWPTAGTLVPDGAGFRLRI